MSELVVQGNDGNNEVVGGANKDVENAVVKPELLPFTGHLGTIGKYDSCTPASSYSYLIIPNQHVCRRIRNPTSSLSSMHCDCVSNRT